MRVKVRTAVQSHTARLHPLPQCALLSPATLRALLPPMPRATAPPAASRAPSSTAGGGTVPVMVSPALARRMKAATRAQGTHARISSPPSATRSPPPSSPATVPVNVSPALQRRMKELAAGRGAAPSAAPAAARATSPPPHTDNNKMPVNVSPALQRRMKELAAGRAAGPSPPTSPSTPEHKKMPVNVSPALQRCMKELAAGRASKSSPTAGRRVVPVTTSPALRRRIEATAARKTTAAAPATPKRAGAVPLMASPEVLRRLKGAARKREAAREAKTPRSVRKKSAVAHMRSLPAAPAPAMTVPMVASPAVLRRMKEIAESQAAPKQVILCIEKEGAGEGELPLLIAARADASVADGVVVLHKYTSGRFALDGLLVNLSVARCVPLHTITFQAFSWVAYRQAARQEETFRKLLCESTHVTGVRQSVVLEAPPSLRSWAACRYEVVEASPLQQGLVTEETTVVVMEPKSARQRVTVPSRPLFGSACETTATGGVAAVHALPHPLVSDALQPPSATPRDVWCDVAASVDTLCAAEVRSGGWVRVVCEDTQRVRVGRVYALDPPALPHASDTTLVVPSIGEHVEMGEWHMSPLLLHNLGFRESMRVSIGPLRATRTLGLGAMRALDQFGTPAEPPVASRVELTRVQGPEDITCTEANVRTHFDRAQRVVASGDVLPIACKDGIVWFAVTLAEPASADGVRVVGGTSTLLVRAGHHNAFVPTHAAEWAAHTPTRPLPPAPTLHSWHRGLYHRVENVLKPALVAGVWSSALLYGASGMGKRTVCAHLARRHCMHLLEVNCYDLVGDTDSKTEKNVQAIFDRAKGACLLLLRRIDALCINTTHDGDPNDVAPTVSILQRCMAAKQAASSPLVPLLVVASTPALSAVVPAVRACFTHEVAADAPTRDEREDILEHLLRHTVIGADVSLHSVALQTAGASFLDLHALVGDATTRTVQRVVAQAREHNVSPADMARAGVCVTSKDVLAAVAQFGKSASAAIGAPSIPRVQWEDVGGLGDVKKEVLDTIDLPLRHPELFASGVKQRSGVLLYGPPGTGKTLLAKAVATECSLNFIHVKGPELINMYVGESERNVREVFERARSALPCVIFFDEIDALAPSRGRGADSGGVMDRIVSQLLVEIDGTHAGANLFVMAATNRPDLVDRALLRPGRFDRLLYVGVSTNRIAQLRILEAQTRRFAMDDGVNLKRVVSKCPEGMTGADFYALTSAALMNAVKRRVAWIKEHNVDVSAVLAGTATMDEEVRQLTLCQRDWDEATRTITPSVSKSEMAYYERVRAEIDANATPQ